MRRAAKKAAVLPFRVLAGGRVPSSASPTVAVSASGALPRQIIVNGETFVSLANVDPDAAEVVLEFIDEHQLPPSSAS